VKRTHVFIAVLLAALSTGLAAGLATGGADAADGTTTATTPATDPGTSTDTTTTVGTDATPTNPTTTLDTTTTTPATTTDPTATLGTTTNGTGGTLPTTSEQTTQSSGSGGSQTQPTTTSAPPVAPCDTTQITCGNNAATQVAIVSQNCNAASGPTLITVQVQTLDGKPVNNYTINPTTTCMNLLAITQIVQQFCINCTLIVLPPPTAGAVASPPKRRALYCMPQPVLRSDGTRGAMVDLEYGQPYVDPTYAGAVLAPYVSGVGYTCPNTSVDDLGSHAPVFTLTVPASFIGQWLNLCIQPTSAAKPTTCHAIRIDNGATVTIPVTSNVAATVTSATGVKGATKTKVKPKSHKQITKASDAFAGARSTSPKKHANVTNSKKKGKR
jgi:hypothetical protein